MLTPRQKELLGHSLVHRGDGKGRPDNTMEALLYTWGRGYTPESDIRYTKDKVVVSFHDGKLKGRKISDYVESTDGADPVVYKRLWEMGFDSFGSDYPEAIYKAIDELEKGE